MTARGAIILFLFGVVLWIVGAGFKIQHWAYAGALILGSSLMQAISAVVIMVKLVRYPGAKDFLDS